MCDDLRRPNWVWWKTRRREPSKHKNVVQMLFKHWPKYHKNVFGKCLFDVKMYGRDLGEKTFLQNVCDDVVKMFFKHFLQHTQKCMIIVLKMLPKTSLEWFLKMFVWRLKCMVRILAGKHFYNTFATMSWKCFSNIFVKYHYNVFHQCFVKHKENVVTMSWKQWYHNIFSLKVYFVLNFLYYIFFCISKLSNDKIWVVSIIMCIIW